jgi:hypothetical protein
MVLGVVHTCLVLFQSIVILWSQCQPSKEGPEPPTKIRAIFCAIGRNIIGHLPVPQLAFVWQYTSWVWLWTAVVAISVAFSPPKLLLQRLLCLIPLLVVSDVLPCWLKWHLWNYLLFLQQTYQLVFLSLVNCPPRAICLNLLLVWWILFCHVFCQAVTTVSLPSYRMVCSLSILFLASYFLAHLGDMAHPLAACLQQKHSFRVSLVCSGSHAEFWCMLCCSLNSLGHG